MSKFPPHFAPEEASQRIPGHVAIIMDGNGRWAKSLGHPRVFGHKHGAERVREVVERAGQTGVKVLTLYAFSDENWLRPIEEIGAIMHLLEHYIRKERRALLEKNVQFRTVGDLSRLAAQTRDLINETKLMLQNNTGLILNVAISYGGRAELTRAFRRIAEKIKEGELAPHQISQELIAENLDTSGLPDPDLMIRTSGELRISNFLLWQSAYTEFYFSDRMWPDFGAAEFDQALQEFASRDRRFGKTTKEISAKKEPAKDLSAHPC